MIGSGTEFLETRGWVLEDEVIAEGPALALEPLAPLVPLSAALLYPPLDAPCEVLCAYEDKDAARDWNASLPLA